MKKLALFRICAVEVEEENSIIEHMQKEHGLQKVRLTTTTTVCLNIVRSHHSLQDVVEQIHSQFHARKHLQKRMVVGVKRMGRGEIRAAIEEEEERAG